MSNLLKTAISDLFFALITSNQERKPSFLLKKDQIMFSKIYVKKNEIALEFKKGEFQTILTAGNHFSFGKKDYELIDLSNRVEVNADLMEYLLRYRQEIVEKQITLLETKSNEVAIFYKDGLPCELILPNSHKYYWTDSLTEPFAIKTLNEYDALSQEDSKEIFTAVNHPTFAIDSSYFYLAHIQKGYLGLLYLHNKLVDIIAENQYFITPSNSEKIRLEIINIETFPHDVYAFCGVRECISG